MACGGGDISPMTPPTSSSAEARLRARFVLHRDACRGRSRNRRRDQGRTRPAAPRDRADRLRKHRQPCGPGSAGLGDDQQICRRLSRQPLLRRLRMGRRRRDAGDRARQETVRRAVCQRAAELRQPDEPGGVSGAAAARRHLHGPRSRRRRPSHPRLARQHVRQVVQGLALHGAARGPDHRHGRSGASRPKRCGQS